MQRSSVEAMAIGLVCAGLMLMLIQEITLQTPLNEAMGKVIYESETLAFEAWQALGRSLDFASRHQFTQLPS